GWVNGPVTLTLSAADAFSGVASTHYSVNGSELATGTEAPVSAEGTNTILYYSLDQAGNRETTRTATVHIDDTAPVTTSNAVTSYMTTATITLMPSDTYSGVARTEYSLNGSQWTSGTVVTADGPDYYTLSFRSIDAIGNVEETHTVSFGVKGRYEQDDPRVSYAGTWQQTTGDYSAGSMLYAGGAESGFTATFNGTGFDWIGLTGPNYGIARVTLDGVTETVSLYSSTYKFQRTILSKRDLSAGPHILRIDWTGTSDPAATGNAICLDALDIIGCISQAPEHLIRYEETDARVSFGGTWESNTGDYSGGSLRFVQGDGTGFLTTFNGTAVDWIGLVGPNYGQARVTLDGITETTSLYSAAYAFQQKIWSKRGLTRGPHTLRVEWTGVREPGSTGDNICLDALDVDGPLTDAPEYLNNYEEAHSRISYGGPWVDTANVNYSGGTMKYVSTTGAGLSLTFNGTGLDWIGTRGPDYGVARITVDGVSETVNLYADTYAFKQKVWTKRGLTDGPHSIRIEYTGVSDPLGSGTKVGVDKFVLVGALTQAPTYLPTTTPYEQTDTRITYGGIWQETASANYSGGTLKYGDSAGTGCNISFKGTGFDLVALTGPTYGMARLTLDGVSETVNFYSPEYKFRKVILSKRDLTDGAHSMRLEWLSEPSPTGINIDAINVVGELLQAPDYLIRFEETDPLISYGGNWTSSSGTLYSAGTMRYGTDAGTGLNISFNGTGIDLLSLKGPTYGIARVTLDGVTSEVSLWNSTYVGQRVIFSSRGLVNGSHTLRFEWTGSADPNGDGTNIGLDAVDVVGALTQAPDFAPPTVRYEETANGVALSGPWTATSSSNYSSGWMQYVSAAATCTFTYTGTGFDWLATMGPDYGIARVTVDGVSETVDLYYPSYRFQRTALSKRGLTQDTHVVTIEWTGQTGAGGGPRINIDAIDIQGTLTP
ncbi:MAG: OmpL47-type beta-barrel domain-containing protein, partial [Coriobacteriia bacterium]